MTNEQELEQLERDVVQVAIEAHCRPDDKDLEKARQQAVSKLIEARYQSIKKSSQ